MNILRTGMNMSISRIHIWLRNNINHFTVNLCQILFKDTY